MIVTLEVKTNSSIGNQTSEYCTSLEEIILPNEVKEIKSKALYMCTSYSGKINLTIYPNLTKVGDEAYFGCNKLFGEISFPDST